jgi:hypothetical protein
LTEIARRIACCARSLIGTRFLLHGRDPAFGLDCVGLVEASLAGAGVQAHLPTGYALRNSSIENILPDIMALSLQETTDFRQAGDIELRRVSAAQFHLLVATSPHDFVHAHAGLRKVVSSTGEPAWPLVKRWRYFENS